MLLAGPSGSGESTLVTGFLERLAEHGYQFCIIDPEGDYENVAEAGVLGDAQRPPSIAEVLQLLTEPTQNAVVNLLGLTLEDRPTFFAPLLSRLQEFLMQTGRPHWVVMDEAHHLLPAAWNPTRQVLTQELTGMLLITVHPDQVAPAVLSSVQRIIAVGESPEATLQALSKALGQHPPALAPVALKPGEALLWARQPEESVAQFRIAPSRIDHIRHQCKYAQGELAADESFYFRGPAGQLNLRAQNLMLFMLSFNNYETVIRRHLKPALGHIPLQALRPEHVQHYYNEKVQHGLEATTIRLHHVTLSHALTLAEKHHLVARNVAQLVEPPRLTRQERRTLAVEEVTTKLLPALKGHRLHAAFLLLFMTGLRRAEVAGLRWQNIDWQGEVMHIRQALVRVKNHAIGRTQLVFQEPKTAHSRRTIPLPEICLAALRHHRAQQAEERLMLGQGYTDHGLVFCRADGAPVDPSTLDRAFS